MAYSLNGESVPKDFGRGEEDEQSESGREQKAESRWRRVVRVEGDEEILARDQHQM